MRLLTYYYAGNTRVGFLWEDKIVDLNRALFKMGRKEEREREILQFSNMVAFLESGEKAIELAKRAYQFVTTADLESNQGIIFNLNEVRLKAPLLKPGKILCVGQNYREHIIEMNLGIPEYPVIFAKFSNCIIGPEDAIPLPNITKQLDYEAEFAFVIGKKAKNVPKEKALDYIAGYTISNDISARDLQMRTSQWVQGKVLDGSLPLGPYIVTKDEIPNPKNLEVSLYVNGEERQHSNTKNLVFDVEMLVEFLSGIITLDPGDLILTGTPGGVGVARDPQTFLQDGDVIKIEIERLGELNNTVKTTLDDHGN